MAAAKRSIRRGTGKRASEKETTPERRFVDIDPWAILLEGLLEVPTEGIVSEGGAEGARPEAGSAAKPKRPKEGGSD